MSTTHYAKVVYGSKITNNIITDFQSSNDITSCSTQSSKYYIFINSSETRVSDHDHFSFEKINLTIEDDWGEILSNFAKENNLTIEEPAWFLNLNSI